MKPGKNMLLLKGMTACFLCMVCCTMDAQVNNKDFIEFYNRQINLYAKSDTLSYDLRYTYANESSPNILIDSVSSHVDKLLNDYHFQIGNTESVTIDSLSLSFFKEDKLLYLSKKNSNSNPQFIIADSVFKNFNDSLIEMTSTGRDNIWTIKFPPNQQYKFIQMLVDKKTGFLNDVIYVVKTDALMPDGLQNKSLQDGTSDEYALVKAHFFNYSRAGNFDKNLFKIETYITRTNNHFITTSRFADYKIFIGSLNL